jgi:hypothetical protein
MEQPESMLYGKSTDDKRRQANRLGQERERKWQAGYERDQDDLIFDTANIYPKSINSNTSI